MTPPRMAYRDGHRCQETMDLAERASKGDVESERERELRGLRGRAEREMEGCACQEMPSVLYMPVPLKPH